MTDQEKIKKATIMLLDGLGVSLDDPNFKETPDRVARTYEEMFKGKGCEKEIKRMLSSKFPSEYKGMVIIDQIKAHSMCPHHLLPVEYDIDFVYIPRGHALGLSKIVRFIRLLSLNAVLQEDLTKKIIDIFNDEINPLGCMVVVKGVHNCMKCRGVKSSGRCITSEVRGDFLKDADLKLEFFELLKR